MKILEARAELVEQKSYPGLFDCKMTHKIKETSASFNYTGPKFTVEMWDEILAFFKWTYAKTHGESQVRLFVHPTEGWRAWAFPQEAGCGLATTELPDNPETKTQRAQFNDEWILYGTVHHHCSVSAFQSGTDTNNEKDQEGIHITVGDMDKDVHTLHFRFYYKGCKFQPDMAGFWDVGQEVRDKAKELAEYFNIKVDLNTVAELQMSQTCGKDAKFPEQWMANLIERARPAITPWPGNGVGLGWGRKNEDFTADQGYRGYPTRAVKMLRKYLRTTYKEDIKAAGGLNAELRDEIDEELESVLEHMADDNDITKVLEAMEKHTCGLPDIIKKFQEIQILEGTSQPPVDEKEIEDELKEEQDAAFDGVIDGIVNDSNKRAINEYEKDFSGYGCT